MSTGNQLNDIGDLEASAGGLVAGPRIVCAAILVQDLLAVTVVHRANCRRPGCPVLAALEVRMVEMGVQRVEASS
jgi:hypothetical protein